ncbi:Peroxiredoxin Bcp [Asticcacaulis sp. MM231]|uniref:peroxiredoxin n=1 Tax=Asticcacaulis sp. MM231 TaxID=3157666 RepID=UPI0032D571C3
MVKSPKTVTSFTPHPAPDFNLASSGGENVSLSGLKGGWTVLFIYPTDNTPTCTQEACDFSAALPEFETLGVKLFGLSKDSLKDHAKFITKYGLKMPLLSDPETTTIDEFGAWGEKTLYGRVYMGTDRSTFIIDPQGLIRKAWRKVKVKGHIDDVLATTKELITE